jgi:histidinol dehydrogenase
VDAATLAAAAAIVDDVRRNDEEALIRQARRLGDLGEGEPWLLPIEAAHEALQAIDTAARDTLERTADRVRRFAEAQRAALHDGAHPVPGGEAGWTWAPVERAGCYAPGGRYPLPSSVIMTAVVARAAGVQEVVVASPRPAPETLAAAAIAGADAFLAVGGAQAIAAMAYGCGALPACDAIVGPGNRWVTAAKQLVSGAVRIDMLAGPSELVVLADATADPARVAADLLAQAEHDPDAIPILLAIDGVEAAVEQALEQQLEDLPTADTARQALRNGFCVATDRQEGAELCDRLAPEHLALHVADAATLAAGLQHYGAVFIGEDAAEVLGDYGAGPNHVLPTGGTARSEGGLSVASFLRCRTWLRIDRPDEQLLADAERLGLMEGLHGHARSAGMRRSRG